MRQRWLLAVVAVLALLTGCSAGVDGTATAEEPAEPFDPCSIPDDTIAAAGLDPGSKSSMAADGYITPGWTICTWESPPPDDWYFFSASFSDKYTLEDVRNNSQNTNIAGTSVGGRDALTYIFQAGTTDDSCDLAFQTEQGLATFNASRKGSEELRGDVCQVVRHYTEALAADLPPA